MAGRYFLSKSISPLSLLAARSATTAASPLRRLRPLLALALALADLSPIAVGVRCFSTRPTTSSLNDPAPNWSNRPPKETILLDGCDFEHWLVVVEPPEPNLTRENIINSYIKTLAQVVGSEEEARMKLYSVSTKHYFAFGALVSEELSYKLKGIPNVRWVLPDCYLDVKNKNYGGEPFIDGQAVPYDPKYHEQWDHNHSNTKDRPKRPRTHDRLRNFERRRENMQNYNRDAPPVPGNTTPTNSSNKQNAPPLPNRDFNVVPPNNTGPSGAYSNQMPNPQGSYVPNGWPSVPPTGPGYQGNPRGYQEGSPGGWSPSGQGYQGGTGGYQGGSPSYLQGGNPGYQQQGYPRTGPNYQHSRPSYQQAGPGVGGPTYPSPPGPNYQQGGQGGGGPHYQGRDMPGRDQ